MPLMAVKLRNRFENAYPMLDVKLKNIRINGNPRGCSGFVTDTATGRVVYLNTEESAYGPMKGQILYRTAKHTKDFTGGRNNLSTDDELVSNVYNLLNK